MRGKQQTGLDETIAELAERQYGKVARAQLLELGLGEKAVEYRVGKGWLRPDYRGVYSLGHRPQSREGKWMAAVLYGGDGAVLSFWSGATLWRMRNGTGPRTHVTTPRKRRSGPTITFHHAQLREDEVTKENGIPTTTPARTLLDLAPSLPIPILAHMIEAAPPGDGAQLATLLERYPRRAGVPKLTVVLAEPRPMTRSDFEAHVLERLEAIGLPRPRVNQVVEGYEVDLVWREHGVIAELDSYVTHGSPLAFEQDRERDRRLTAAGWRVVRLTDRRTQTGLEDLSRLLAATAAHSRGHRAVA
jgi:very-short-patch-repair endonuclease